MSYRLSNAEATPARQAPRNSHQLCQSARPPADAPDRVVQAAAGLDADIRALADDGRAQRIHGMRWLAQRLADRGALKPGMTAPEAADILWLLNDPGVYHRLVNEQHWPPDRYQDWLADALISLLIPASYQPKTDPPQHP